MKMNNLRTNKFGLLVGLLLLSACNGQIHSWYSQPLKEGETQSSSMDNGLQTPLPKTVLPIIALEHPFESVSFKVGQYEFEFHLIENPDFGPNPSMAWMYSDIPGVGVHVSWEYSGPGMDGPIVEYWGRCPDINPLDTLTGLKYRQSGIREGGVLLPQDVPSGSVVQYVFTLESPQGTFGGILSALLLQGSQGYELSQVTIYPIEQQGPIDVCIS